MRLWKSSQSSQNSTTHTQVASWWNVPSSSPTHQTCQLLLVRHQFTQPWRWQSTIVRWVSAYSSWQTQLLVGLRLSVRCQTVWKSCLDLMRSQWTSVPSSLTSTVVQVTFTSTMARLVQSHSSVLCRQPVVTWRSLWQRTQRRLLAASMVLSRIVPTRSAIQP